MMPASQEKTRVLVIGIDVAPNQKIYSGSIADLLRFPRSLRLVRNYWHNPKVGKKGLGDWPGYARDARQLICGGFPDCCDTPEMAEKRQARDSADTRNVLQE